MRTRILFYDLTLAMEMMFYLAIVAFGLSCASVPLPAPWPTYAKCPPAPWPPSDTRPATTAGAQGE